MKLTSTPERGTGASVTYDGDDEAVRWAWSDGEVDGDTGSATAVHEWSQPGLYVVTVTERGGGRGSRPVGVGGVWSAGKGIPPVDWGDVADVVGPSRKAAAGPVGTGSEAVAVFDPGAHTIAEVLAYVDAHPSEAELVLAAEQTGKARVTLIADLEARTS
jgi:hypothetical protein